MDDYRKMLFYNKKNGYDRVSTEERIKIEDYCSEYIAYLDSSRTEREAVINAVTYAEEHGFKEFSSDSELKPGDRIYYNNRGKGLFLAVIGKESLNKGTIIAGAHIDAPRLDIKPVPMYEKEELGYLRTHYYGGIKKYQWVAIPLELHGVVVLKNGEFVNVCIGRNNGDPRFVITDLLPHLAADQMKKTMAEGITGESLNVVIGSVPYDCEGSDRVKLALLSILYDEYGITEDDFLSAELEAVPAFDVSEIGLDKSLIGAYGHDDRVCAFAELKAISETSAADRTCLCILADKEETGSYGVSGMQSAAFDKFVYDLCRVSGSDYMTCLSNSVCISADVCNAYDPLYPDVSEIANSAKINYGMGICKYTGSGGKANTSDASAELVGRVRKVLDDNDVVWQLSELGKVDQGGGGTIAKYMADRNVDTIDAGVPVLSMHAPFETVSKLDCYMTYKGILAVYDKF